MELHHKNGNHDDNKLSNLQILCPNCHSQTDNFRALNISKREDDITNHKIKKEKQRKYSKKICPICNTNEIHISSKMCRACYKKSVQNLNIDNETVIKIGHNLKDLCPVCKTNYKSITSAMCDSCRFEERSRPKIEKEKLEQLIYQLPFTQIGKMFGVSDNSVRKWCKKYGLPHSKADIVKTN